MANKKVKILILGLSNSGKTSLVLTLQKNVNLLSFYSLKPTKGVDRVEFEDHDTKFHIWDYGGQEQYRADHLKNFPDHLIGTNKVIYTIDIQDKKKYELSLDFLNEILKILQEQKFNVNISVFLHKFDPDFEMKEKELSDLLEKIQFLIPKSFTFQVFKTTIYTVFRKFLLI